jgi:hypothetical protein
MNTSEEFYSSRILNALRQHIFQNNYFLALRIDIILKEQFLCFSLVFTLLNYGAEFNMLVSAEYAIFLTLILIRLFLI